MCSTSSDGTLPRLPLELCFAVIDNLRHSPRDLISCALVCKDWADQCRPHIFASVTFRAEAFSTKARPRHDKYDEAVQERWHNLSTFLIANPNICSSVSRLAISGSYLAPNLHRILPLLKNVTWLSLRHLSYTYTSLHDFRIIPRYFICLSSQLKSMAIDASPCPPAVTLSSYCDFRWALNCFATSSAILEYLHLSSIFIHRFEHTSAPAPDDEAPINRISLKTMTMYNCSNMEKWLIWSYCPIDLSSLQNLLILWDDDHIGDAYTLLPNLLRYLFVLPVRKPGKFTSVTLTAM